ncbi:MAG: DUF4625 domain-containing protein [Salinivirgaceae bacterium]
MKKQILLIAAIAVALVSCKKEDVDNTAPEINMVQPVFDQVIAIGSAIPFEATFTDNVALKAYKIDIHSAEGHVHTKNAKLNQSEGHPWTYEKSWDFEMGLTQSEVKHNLIEVPDSIMGEEGFLVPVMPGEYHMGIFCTDISGNENHVFIDIILE